MAPEILFAKGYDHKVDVWALGALFFTMLTSMYVFNAESMKQLEQRVARGDWKWPKNIDFSLQGLEFLQQTFQFNSENRLSWEQICHHPYLSLQTVDTIPLNILYGDESGSYSKEGITINTRDPAKFERLYAEASARMMKQGEAKLESELDSLVDRH